MLRTRAPLRPLYQILHSTPSSTPRLPKAPPLLHSTLSSPFSSSSSDDEGGERDDLGVLALRRGPGGPPKLFVVQPRLRPESLLQAKLSEALNLANSLEDQRDLDAGVEGDKKELPPHRVVQNPLARSKGRADKYFGPGTVDDVKCHIQALDSEDGPDAIFVNAVLSGIQQRNLECAWGKPVLDRVGLIIEIFNAHAQTKEAKLQSELAALMYKRTRLVRVRGPDGRLTFGASGESEVVSARGKGSGGRGFLSGAGESEIQLQRQRIQERRERLLHEIEEVRRTRALQRYARRRRGGLQGQGLSTVAVVGYTNAGKSTLVSALSQSILYSDDRLFATVDPLLRSVILPSGVKILLSDTVGFISDLPVQLVEAFHATLEEVVDADLLLHVLDANAIDVNDQRRTVLHVLHQIGVSEEKIQNMIEVWNKVDLLESRTDSIGHPDQDEGINDKCEVVFSCHSDCSLGQQSISEHEDDDLPYEAGDALVTGETFLTEYECENSTNECRHEPDVLGTLLCRERAGFVDTDETKDCFSNHDEVGDVQSPSGYGCLTSNDHLDSGNGSSLERRRDLEVPTLSTCELKDVPCVKTSAVTGVGLQELLYAIDEKLTMKKSTEKRVAFSYFDRKWRPSHNKDSNKEALS